MRQRRKRRASKSNRRGMMGIAFVVMVLLIALLVQSQNLIRKNQQYTERKEELEQELKDQEIRAEEIENLKDYVNSTEFIEKVARDKLGLVYEDEIIFKAEE
ncbi:MAG TPA: septum formation initiator family protein [Candidatus Choladousia intestinavium]|uniref:Septum formation initiator family protein n=1 Tax=Candidatus Choladousia intestinavium TaxID=2840727 RepID=A0A9D1ADF5_9FIRM|nr:septum formation initiator family protein [Candidatus Choladousia intestinavium]